MSGLSVLITGAGTVTAVSVIKGLRLQNEIKVHIIAADMNDFVIGRYFADEFVEIPPSNKEEFISELLSICKLKKVDMLIPIIDYEFKKISENRHRFEQIQCKPIISSSETIKICNNKFLTYKFFIQNNIPTAKSYESKDIRKNINEIVFPLFIKPAFDGRSSINSFKINNREELQYYMNIIKNPIVQEYINGQEYTLDGLNDLNGKPICIVPRIRIETKGGVSVKGKTIYDREMMDWGMKISEKLGIIGPFNIQCFRSKSSIVFIEINPRFSGAHALTILSGLNSAHLLCKMIIGHKVEPFLNKIKYNISMLRYWNETFLDENDNKIQFQWPL